MALRNWFALLLIAAAGGCSGSTTQVNLAGSGSGGTAQVNVGGGTGDVSAVSDDPPVVIEGEIRDGELRGVTPTPAPITPVAALETPVPTATPRPR